MSRLDEAIKKQNDYLCRIDGPINLHESDGKYNDLNRELIAAFKEHHGKAFLGHINFYGDERNEIVNGKKSIYTEYVGQMICNFDYVFCIPLEDAELEEMIKRWNCAGDSSSDTAQHIPKSAEIIEKLGAIGGISLIWC